MTPENVRKEFFSAIFGDTPYNIELRAIIPGDHAINDFFSPNDLYGIERFIKTHATSRNIYFGVCPRQGRIGTKEGVRQVPGLWLDIDFEYLTGGEAEAKEILTQMPSPSIIVHSGNGYHVYWIFNEPEEASLEFEAYLNGLAKRYNGDPKSAELARILRVPGTLNHKEGQQKPVILKKQNGVRYNLSDFEDFKDETPNDAGGTVKSVDLKDITDKCKFIKHCDEEKKDLPEPLWYAAASILARISPRGPSLVHEISQGYPRYTRSETDRKILHALDSSGPHTCKNIKETMQAYLGKDCGKDCKVTSPIVLFTQKRTLIKYQEPEIKTQVDHWPNPPAPEAYYGLAGDIVNTIEPHTEADPVGLLVQLLISLGNSIGPTPFFSVESDRHRLNISGVLVGDTAKGRKGTSWGYCRKFLDEIDPEWARERIQSGLSSGEGLIWAVRDPIYKSEPIREGKEITGYREVIIDKGIEDKRLLALEPEFASLLRNSGRDGNTLSAIVRQAWENGHLRTLTKNSPANATGAHISIVGHITKTELVRYLDKTEAANGFGNRFLWVCVKRSKCLPEGGRLNEVDLSSLITRLEKVVRFSRTAGELQRDEAASQMWCDVYPELSKGYSGMFGFMTSRAEAQVLRLSCLYALLDCSSIIRQEHMLAALALWEYCEASVRYIFGTAIGDPVADEIIRALKGAPEGLSRTDISNHLGRHKKSNEINRSLHFLSEEGYITMIMKEDTGGRPVEIWKYV